MTLKITVFLALAACTVAEPPSGYNYDRPSVGVEVGRGSSLRSSSSQSDFGSFSSFGGFDDLSASELVDAKLLGQIQQLLLQDEIRENAQRSSAPSGAPGTYGAPIHRQNVVGVHLEGAQRSIPVHEYSERINSARFSGSGHGSGSGYQYSPPSSSYGAP